MISKGTGSCGLFRYKKVIILNTQEVLSDERVKQTERKKNRTERNMRSFTKLCMNRWVGKSNNENTS